MYGGSSPVPDEHRAFLIYAPEGRLEVEVVDIEKAYHSLNSRMRGRTENTSESLPHVVVLKSRAKSRKELCRQDVPTRRVALPFLRDKSAMALNRHVDHDENSDTRRDCVTFAVSFAGVLGTCLLVVIEDCNRGRDMTWALGLI
ncbi:hypothetical protein M378DRAFT_159531 [Amanita muscaria Koide BX008]|uniref:Uncharacterized protein n=1 Tax=Amanita muscaria (strain Koide BX008) TaxID=946122 RepID=A0A0C2TKV1_AMAMK|nr:hypothetical protein M378DRAFT_159531 [Amanita muscaria Koide BX008]